MTAKKIRNSRKTIIAVIGGGQCSPEEIEIAEQAGREIARQGAVLVCGGLGGIMAAACRGAKSESGLTVGILPGDDPLAANENVDLPIPTGLGHARNVLVVQTAQAVIAIDGDYGTLSEIAIALKCGIPVIGLKTWSLSKEGKMDNSIILADNAADAVSLAMKYSQQGREGIR